MPDEMVAFHAQQAVEKRLKAVLAHHGVDYERTHNLGCLVANLVKGVEPPRDPERLKDLSPWAGRFRYEDVSDRSIDRADVLVLVRTGRDWSQSVLGR